MYPQEVMRVLLPIDTNDERAITAAETVTTLPEASGNVQVTILNVEKEVEYREDSVERSADWYDPEEYPQSVDEAAKILENAGITFEKRREHGNPSEAILEVASEIEPARIIMAGRQRTPVGKVLFGSVTQSVLLGSDVPVTVIAK